MGRFPLNQNSGIFGNAGKWYKTFQGKFIENPKIVKFPKYVPFEDFKNPGNKIK